ncbi:hypothetical protein M2650_08320 [Luteimonas sp. SX5]|uniref:Glycosyltransferase RgtA/B/C/D-like domain-containing protein n=1 Tax=Luteimonas galliterrae TaxID=2940486 RepID=A0ABT0MID4_9GAMM|nr:hypothetical protein [Luteimonas galliterrae]MCL1634634.1 hypothetical protein [Luteimonas galliterrae]
MNLSSPSANAYIFRDTGRAIELLTVWVLSMSAAGLLSLRLGIFSAPQIWLAAVGMAGGYGYLTRRSALVSGWFPPLWQIALVLGVGLFFRLTPYVYVLGGQDQGLYMNMAMELARTGALQPVDHVLAGMTDPAHRMLYQAANYAPSYLPGNYTTADGLVFQFYHLFPVWLALFELGGGPGFAVYGLVFLSLLSLLYFQCLAQMLTGSARVGLAAGLLLAVNPLHAFFSKFPLTEVPTMAFSAMALTFVALYWRSRDEGGGARMLVLSAAAFGLVFATRISGFMYMPFVLAVFVTVLLFEGTSERRRALLLWVGAVVSLYVVSVLYGLKWSAPYARDIYAGAFGPLLGDRWKGILLSLIGLAAATCVALWIVVRRDWKLDWLRRLAGFGGKALPFLAVLFAAIALYKAYRLGFTDAYSQDPWLGTRLRLSHQGWRAVAANSFVAGTVYLSPFIMAAFFVASFRRSLAMELRLLLFFAICFFAHVCVLLWYLPYQPYYARYLVSEFVPYLLLFTLCASASATAAQVWLRTLLALGGIWCLALSFMQLGKEENGGTLESLDRMAALADRGDIILLDSSLNFSFSRELKTPLVYSYGLNAIRINADDLCNADYIAALDKKYDDVYLVSDDPERRAGFVPVESIRLLTMAFKHGSSPPTSVGPRYDLELRLHRLADAETRLKCAISWRSKDILGSGWSSPEGWGVWTNSTRAQIKLPQTVLAPDQSARELVLKGRVYTRPGAPLQRIRVLRDRRTLMETEVRHPASRVELVVPLAPLAPLPDSEGLTLELETPDAASPLSLGESSDGRQLAFGLEAMTIR